MNSLKEILYTANLSGSLKLSANGEWFHNGIRFQNERLAKLFHNSIVWDQTKQMYFVEIGQQRAKFDIEDTPFFVTTIDDSKEPWLITLKDDSTEELRYETLSIGSKDQIYCNVKETHQARFTRQAYQQLVNHVVDDEHIAIGSKLVCLKRCTNSK